MAVNRDSEKFIAARDSLPKELQPIYEELVEEYAFFTTKHHGRGYVAYKVLASLVEYGWRSARHEQSNAMDEGAVDSA